MMDHPAPAIRVLLVDDDDTFRKVFSAELERRGYAVNTAHDGRRALAPEATADVDVILLDLSLPDMDGIEVLKEIRAREVAAGVIVLTGHGTIDTAIQATRLGAYDYLQKPCPLDQVEMALKRTHEHVHLEQRQRVLKDGYGTAHLEAAFIGASEAFRQLDALIDRIARADTTTLVLGETGVGKDLVARLIHARSERREEPFVVLDCTALHENLLQSELFGHEKGAFTGAQRQRHGLFEVAHGGTLFLDEVGDTSLEIQAQLLRVLETGRYRRVGGTREISVDVRLVSATNHDLEEAVARGRFRRDLYFRLNALSIVVPPLRGRVEDIRVLVQHYTQRVNQRFGGAKTFSRTAFDALLAYTWPGNIRELAHVVERALLLSEQDVIDLADLPAAMRAPASISKAAPDVGLHPLHEVERRHVLAVLERIGGNRAHAARILEISERNLYRLLKKYGEPTRAEDPAPGAAPAP